MPEQLTQHCGPHCGTKDGATAHCAGCHHGKDHGNADLLAGGWAPHVEVTPARPWAPRDPCGACGSRNTYWLRRGVAACDDCRATDYDETGPPRRGHASRQPCTCGRVAEGAAFHLRTCPSYTPERTTHA